MIVIVNSSNEVSVFASNRGRPQATGMEGVGHTDDLLDLGVDSSTAVGISSDLSEACGHDLPAELVFGHTTVLDITDYVAALGQAKEKTATGCVVFDCFLAQCRRGVRYGRSHVLFTYMH